MKSKHMKRVLTSLQDQSQACWRPSKMSKIRIVTSLALVRSIMLLLSVLVYIIIIMYTQYMNMDMP